MGNNKIVSNENINLDDNEREEMIDSIEDNFKNIFNKLRFDWENDYNMKGTPRRMAKMYVNELFKGSYEDEPDITIFPNDREYNEIISSGPINIKSMCSHHFMPFNGSAWIGYIPDDYVVGISKLTRITRWFMRRPQIQEELTEQIANYLQDKLKNPRGIIIVIKCKHYCMIQRGVQEDNAVMTTSVVKGKFKDNPAAKNEFLELIDVNI